MSKDIVGKNRIKRLLLPLENKCFSKLFYTDQEKLINRQKIIFYKINY